MILIETRNNNYYFIKKPPIYLVVSFFIRIFVIEIRTTTIMNSRNIFEIIRSKQLLSEFYWRKRYDNGTSLWEYKIYKPKSRKPIAFVQIGEYDNTGNIIGLSVTYANDMQNPIDCDTFTEFEKALDNIICQTKQIQ